MTCPRCGSRQIREEWTYDDVGNRVKAPYCYMCGWRPSSRRGCDVQESTTAQEEDEMGGARKKCSIEGCSGKNQRLGLCNTHFKEQYGVAIYKYNEQLREQREQADRDILNRKIPETPAPPPPAEAEEFADPETGRVDLRARKTKEIYVLSVGDDQATIEVDVKKGKISRVVLSSPPEQEIAISPAFLIALGREFARLQEGRP